LAHYDFKLTNYREPQAETVTQSAIIDNTVFSRIIWIVLDSVGIGEMPAD